jgi:hypothetical protein
MVSFSQAGMKQHGKNIRAKYLPKIFKQLSNEFSRRSITVNARNPILCLLRVISAFQVSPQPASVGLARLGAG